MRRTLALAMALVLTAAPVLSCCLARAGSAHAAGMETPLSGYASGTSVHDHCANGEAAPAPVPDEENICDNCARFDFVQSAKITIVGESALLTQAKFTSLAIAARSRPDFTPALLRMVAPSQGPPLDHITPVLLKTLLRL